MGKRKALRAANMGPRNKKRKHLRKMPKDLTPPVKSAQDAPLWEMDGYGFQGLCCALFEQEEEVRTCSVYGTRGQKQFGIDLLANNHAPDEHSVVQCKCHREFGPSEIRAVSHEFFDHWEDKWCDRNITRFVLMVACDLESTQTQEEIIEQKKAFQDKGITYEVWSRQTICNRLRPHRGIASQYLNVEWVDRLCAPSIPTIPETGSGQPKRVHALLANQLERSLSVIERDTASQLDEFREISREGDMQRAHDWITEAKTDLDRWSSLTPDVQAKILRFEASLCLEMGELENAKTIAEEACSITPQFDDAVLRALLALHEHGPERALQEIEDACSDVDSLNLKAFLLLENGDSDGCAALFSDHSELLNDDPETTRLRGMLLRMQGDPEGAAELISEAYALKPNWVAVRFARALIDFERALAPGILEHEFCPAIRIIDWAFIRTDDLSLQRIRDAAAIFDELLHSSTSNPARKLFLEGWKLTCLACDFERQDDADAYCRVLLTATADHPVGIMWALGRGYARDALDASIVHLESLRKKRKAEPEHVARLVMCYAAQENSKRALTVLRKTKGLFKKSDTRTTWLVWMTQILASDRKLHEALGLLKEIPDAVLRGRIKGVILSTFLDDEKAGEDAIEHFLSCYEESGSGEFLLGACSIMARFNHWQKLCEHVDSLVASVGTAESLRLCAVALFNIKSYRQALELIEDHKNVFPSANPSHEIRTLLIQCRIHVGQINEAVADARILYEQNPSPSNLCLFADTLSRRGDFAELEGLVHSLDSEGSLSPEISLFLCDQIKGRNPKLAKELLKGNLHAGLPNNLMAATLQRVFGLGLEDEATTLIERIPQIANATDTIQSVQLQDIAQMMKKKRTQRMESDNEYLAARLPIHILAERSGSSLAVFYHTNLLLNERNESSPPTTLLARHGGLPVANDLGEEKPPWLLSADLTALMLAYHIGILESVMATFGPIRISSQTIPALRQMRDRLKHQQPSRLAAQETILRLAGSEKLRVRNSLTPSVNPETEELLRRYPDEWVSLFEQMQASSGFLVDFLPPSGRDVLAESPDLPDFCRPVVTNLRAVVDSLFEHGPFSQTEHEIAIGRLGTYGKEEASTPIPSQGCPIHLHEATAETLAQCSALVVLCDRFTVSIDQGVLEEYKSEVNQTRPILDETAQWLDDLIDVISRGIKSEAFQPVPIFSDSRNSNQEALASACLLDILSAQVQDESRGMLNAIWCDDRSMQSESIKGDYLVLGIFEILKGLVASSAINKETYFEKLLHLRSARVLFLPIEPEEIVYHLAQASVTGGELVESGALSVLRRYAATCLSQDNTFLKPSQNPQCRSDFGEIDIVLNLSSTPSQVLAQVWNMTPRDETVCAARAEWVVKNLYISTIGALNVSGVREHWHDAEQFECLNVCSMLLNSLMINETTDENNRPRRDYLHWIYGRLLQKRFRSCATLLDEVVSCITDNSEARGFFRGELGDEDIGLSDGGLGEDPNKYRLVWKVIQQRIFDDFPDAVKNGFIDRQAFLDNIGVVVQVQVEGEAYSRSDFLDAAAEAVNGTRTRCRVSDSDTSDDFLPTEDSNSSVPFLISRSDSTKPVNDEAFWILHESPDRCREVLLQHRDWFACPDEEFESCVEEICAISSPRERFETVMNWRSSSANVFYGDLEKRLKATKDVDFDELKPSKPEHILYKYLNRHSQNEETDVIECLSQAGAHRIAVEGFEKAFLVAAAIPVSLPESILAHFCSLDDEMQKGILASIADEVLTPLTRIHLIHLALAAGNIPREESASRQVSHLLSEEGSCEIAAFLSLLSWVTAGLDFWPEVNQWPTCDKLVAIWGHTSDLLQILLRVGTPWQRIKDTFGNAETQLSLELFVGGGPYRHDIANPKNLNQETFLLPGLAYAVGNSDILSEDDKDVVRSNALEAIGADGREKFLRPKLLRDPNQQSNALGSFLNIDRGLMLEALLGKPDESTFLSDLLRENVCRSVAELEERPDDHLCWLQLITILTDSPPYEEIRDALTRVLGEVNISEVLAMAQSGVQTSLLGIAFSVLHVGDREALSRIKDSVIEFASQTPRQEHEAGQPEGIDTLDSILETLFNIATRETSVDDRVKSFADSLGKLQKTYGQKQFLAVMTRRLTEELPPHIAEHFWRIRIIERRRA